MMYTPDPKSLVYSQLQFISTSVPLPQAKISVDIEAIYDEVSSEIFALFVGVESQITAEAIREYTASLQVNKGLEIAN
jgi:hypothetical protein